MTQLQTNYVQETAPVSEISNNQNSNSTRKAGYGRTIGEPKLSDEAQKYYEQLKKKFNNYDFILVSRDEKENAKANAAKYAGGLKTVVLIDEDKIEKMATDPEYRKKYEDILSGAMNNLDQIKSSLSQSGTVAQSLGMQVNDDGTISYFAVLKTMSDTQKEWIEHRAEKRAAEKKADKIADKKAELEARRNERLENKWKNSVTITADSAEELLLKIQDFEFNERSNNIQTEEEKMLGQNIDFRG